MSMTTKGDTEVCKFHTVYIAHLATALTLEGPGACTNICGIGGDNGARMLLPISSMLHLYIMVSILKIH